MEPSDRVREKWREHARDPYEFYPVRYILPHTQALDERYEEYRKAWEGVFNLIQKVKEKEVHWG